MIRPVLRMGDPVLLQKSVAVEKFGTVLRKPLGIESRSVPRR